MRLGLGYLLWVGLAHVGVEEFLLFLNLLKVEVEDVLTAKAHRFERWHHQSSCFRPVFLSLLIPSPFIDLSLTEPSFLGYL
jgi:hypothetical protein